MLGLNFFRQIWLYDFEFTAPEGDNPDVICLVAHELHSGQKLRLWRDELGAEPPFSTAADVLFVAYYASAEVGCHLALSWPVPLRLLDLFTEFRCLTNGTPPPCGNGLIGALAYFGLRQYRRSGKRGNARLGHAGRTVDAYGALGAFGLLRVGCGSVDAVVVSNVAFD